jgi:murein DD-endopeptidase MepM/ murein hydrolase activator NlpD
MSDKVFFNSKFRITQYFANKDVYQYEDYYSKFDLYGHNGIDLVPLNKKDLRLYNRHEGIVVFNSCNGGYGNCIKIWNVEKGILEYYCHLDYIHKDITLGKKIKKGTLLGKIGNTGGSFGIHLHYGIFKVDKNMSKLNANRNDKNCIKGAINPLLYLK